MACDKCNAAMNIDVLAPLDRAPMEVVRRQSRQFHDIPALRALMDAVPGVLLVLNESRQIVFANAALTDLLGLDDVMAVYGRRPGEVLGCEHAFECPGGCGTAEACTLCGAARAIAFCEDGVRSTQECRIIQRHSGQALDLRINGEGVAAAEFDLRL
jgi:PAS domain-containing protein